MDTISAEIIRAEVAVSYWAYYLHQEVLRFVVFVGVCVCLFVCLCVRSFVNVCSLTCIGVEYRPIESGWRYRLRHNEAPIGNGTWRIEWSRA